MCHKSVCSSCNKPTWVGCGRHVESALQGIPEEERCHCKPWTQEMVNENGGGKGCLIF
ncbi:hypothetical protein AV274_3624 [Blastocystis sp. ATCC 50177/Nand II]|uniref:Uncharacterized protein n=1 Tax=Blastocystis sp. subtype 1 (strain ATCC 50177 / NandII) TaxID=478820 RepID=A0A196SCI0_BLAHN|nr:hypothetical protein AV274_3624 [Blastocystis sp. ATCC 50177/Nand II]